MNFHGFDAAAGAIPGAAVGALIYALRKRKGEKVNPWSVLGHIGAGAAVGAGVGNIVGDLGRRYVSNNLVPVGYGSERVADLKPRSLRQVWRTTVQDLPADDVPLQAFSGIDPEAVGIRRELLRRELGVHVPKPNDATLTAPDGTVRLNPDRFEPQDTDWIYSHRTGNGFTFTDLLGSYKEKPTEVSDRWDFDLHPAEQQHFKQLRAQLFKGNPIGLGKRWGELAKQYSGQRDEYLPGHDDQQRLKSYAARVVLNTAVGDNAVQFRQPIGTP